MKRPAMTFRIKPETRSGRGSACLLCTARLGHSGRHASFRRVRLRQGRHCCFELWRSTAMRRAQVLFVVKAPSEHQEAFLEAY